MRLCSYAIFARRLARRTERATARRVSQRSVCVRSGFVVGFSRSSVSRSTGLREDELARWVGAGEAYVCRQQDAVQSLGQSHVEPIESADVGLQLQRSSELRVIRYDMVLFEGRGFRHSRTCRVRADRLARTKRANAESTSAG